MKNTNIIPFMGETPSFRNTENSNFEKITPRTFTNKAMRDFDPVQSLKFIWEKSSEYLQKIIEKKDSKILKKAILEIAAKDLAFNPQEQEKPNLGLDQKLRTTIRNSYSKLKPTK